MSSESKTVYFAQHGLAVDKTENPDRPLSRNGITQTEAVAKALQVAKTPIKHIFHSGKLRATQTAEIFAQALNINSISSIDGLAPNDEVSLLAQNMNTNDSLYVGHLPHLEKMVAYLVTETTDMTIVKFQNSAVACLKKNDTRYHLQWYLPPELVTDS
jgi:phosphohistidine phosphatase